MELRKRNNDIKRVFLTQWVQKGSRVLDVGCGQGGDIHKWKHIGVSLVGVDPNPWAIEEARRRSQGKYGTFIVGDIRSAPVELFDVICYNFSLQYQPLELLSEVTKRLKPSGLLIGTVTNSTESHEEIQIEKIDSERIRVYIPDTPYYANGPVIEPILDKRALITKAHELGLELLLWETFSVYAKFVFRYI